MVICKYFKEGYCRYGERCRYEHSYQSKYSYHAPSPSAQSPVQSSGPTLTQQQVAAVAVDVGSSVIGKQWLLSSYGPFPFKKSVPGLQDVSPEEVRLAMYEAKANNTGEHAIASYNSMVQDAKAKYNKLIDLDQSVINTLSKIYNGETAQSPFGLQSSPQSIFGGQNKATNVFGGKNSSSNAFSSQRSTPQNVFGSPASQSIFGGNASIQSAQSVFGGKNSTPNALGAKTTASNLFGGQAGASNIFGGQTSASNAFSGQTSASNVFGSQKSTQNVFGDQMKAQNVFSGQASSPQSLFGGQNAPESVIGSSNSFTQSNPSATQSILGSQSGSFNEQNKAQNIFSSVASPNIFASPQKVEPSQSTFGSSNIANVFAQMPQNEFNQNQTSAQTVFGQIRTQFATSPLSNAISTQSIQDSLEVTQSAFHPNASSEGDFYSILTDLSPEDLEQYKADSFEFGFIPELPPPHELCF